MGFRQQKKKEIGKTYDMIPYPISNRIINGFKKDLVFKRYDLDGYA